MQSTHAEDSAPEGNEQPWWRPIVHRWFVEYNPLYLMSAGLVLGGIFLLSRALADAEVLGSLGVAAIAETYSWALIAGAAVLMRVGHRRAAVMLALLTALYQFDLTLLTETAPHLGALGAVASTAWVGSFALKLIALARAMRVKLSAQTLAAAGSSAVGLAVMPHLLQWTGAQDVSATIGLVAIAVSAIQQRTVVTSDVELDEWGATVLRRTVRAIWSVWALLLALHVLFWSTRCRIELPPLLPLLPLFAVRTIRRERRVALVIVATLIVCALVLPSALSTTALVAAASLVARAFAPTAAHDVAVAVPIAAPPYRSPAADAPVAASVERVVITSASADRPRLLAGAVLCAYLSVWTLGWSGGEWPAHVLALDVALMMGSVFAVRRGVRTRIPLVAAIATWSHYASTVVPLPRSALAVGATSVALGFALLAGCVGAAWWWRPRPHPHRAVEDA